MYVPRSMQEQIYRARFVMYPAWALDGGCRCQSVDDGRHVSVRCFHKQMQMRRVRIELSTLGL